MSRQVEQDIEHWAARLRGGRVLGMMQGRTFVA